mmetsp:Transcript_20944/g.70332  ORF Transcript_20944/g.70332 Transcript_20944/m.70332 type:complete len:325 (+) Transcript_20944:79-1053(+)
MKRPSGRGAAGKGPARSVKQAPRPKKVKPRVQRALDRRAPKVVENPKALLGLHSTSTSQLIKSVVNDIVLLRKPHARRLGKKNPVRPFEDATPLEFLARKNDASLLAFGSHSKKRPNCLTLARTFDHGVLDMAEFLVSNFRSLADLRGSYRAASFPALVFCGDAFEHSADMRVVKSLLQDLLRPDGVGVVPARTPVDRVLVCTAVGEDVLALRHYAVDGGREGAAPPPGPRSLPMHRRVELAEIGPRMDLKLSRTRFADEELRKAACKQPPPPGAVPRKEKNVTHGELLGKRGRLRVERQDLNQAALKKVKALRKQRTPEGQAA